MKVKMYTCVYIVIYIYIWLIFIFSFDSYKKKVGQSE